MKGLKIALIILFTAVNAIGQTCHFTSSGNWNKSPLAGSNCSAAQIANATLIYIDPGVTVTIFNQSITWGANVIVQGTLSIDNTLSLFKTPSCDLEVTIEAGGKITTPNGNAAKEILNICGTTVVDNKGNGLFDWSDFPNGEITGPNTIDQSGGTLPVDLTSFTASSTENSIILSWITASEQNNDYFTLERSRNGKDFETIGKIEGAGTTNIESKYSFTDSNPYLGLSYYRLSQTDYDGQFEVFPAISVLFTHEKTNFSVYPNPIIDQTVRFKISGKTKNEKLTLNIIDPQGKRIEQKTFSADFYGNLEAELSLSRPVQTGLYIFELISLSGTEYLKVAGK